MAITLALMLSTAASGRADIVRLKNGGEVRGKVDVAARRRNPTEVRIKTLRGTHITLDAESVEFVTPRGLDVEEYETRARQVADTVDARWELAEWAKSEGLARQQDEQLEAILLLQPDHAGAHVGLGHRQHKGEWMTRAAVMAEMGYFKHAGRYVTQQEYDLLIKSEKERAAERAWYPKVKLWLGWATEHRTKGAEGVAMLQAINDEDATPALENFLSDHNNVQVRKAYVSILRQLGGEKPIRPLVRQSLFDVNQTIRRAALEGLSEEQHENAGYLYVSELKSRSNQVVRRSASALATVGDDKAIPALIDALVTTHKYQVRVPVDTPTSAGPAVRAGFGSILPTNCSSPGGCSLGGRSGGGSGVNLTGGRVLTGLPAGSFLLPPTYRQPTRLMTVKVRQQNEEVLAALKELTGENFGYDARTWHLWWTAHQQDVG